MLDVRKIKRIKQVLETSEGYNLNVDKIQIASKFQPVRTHKKLIWKSINALYRFFQCITEHN